MLIRRPPKYPKVAFIYIIKPLCIHTSYSMSFDKDTNLTATYGEIHHFSVISHPLHTTPRHFPTPMLPLLTQYTAPIPTQFASIYIIYIDSETNHILSKANLGNNKLINTIMNMRG